MSLPVDDATDEVDSFHQSAMETETSVIYKGGHVEMEELLDTKHSKDDLEICASENVEMVDQVKTPKNQESAGDEGSDDGSGDQPMVYIDTAEQNTDDEGDVNVSSDDEQENNSCVDSNNANTNESLVQDGTATILDESRSSSDVTDKQNRIKPSSVGNQLSFQIEKNEGYSISMENDSVVMRNDTIKVNKVGTMENDLVTMGNDSVSKENDSETIGNDLEKRKVDSVVEVDYLITMEDGSVVEENVSEMKGDKPVSDSGKTDGVEKIIPTTETTSDDLTSDSLSKVPQSLSPDRSAISTEPEPKINISQNPVLENLESNQQCRPEIGVECLNKDNETMNSSSVKTLNFNSYNADFDISEASESDQSPRLVIEMPEVSENESINSPIKEIEKECLTTDTINDVHNEAAETSSDTLCKVTEIRDRESSDKSNDLIGQQTKAVSKNDTRVENLSVTDRSKAATNTTVKKSEVVVSTGNHGNTTMNKVVVKQEPEENAANSRMEEGGDILDILNSRNTENSVIITDRSNVNNETAVSQNTTDMVDNSLKIKSEPVNAGYELYESFYANSSNSDKTNDQNSSQSNSSLSQLSKQVQNLTPNGSVSNLTAVSSMSSQLTNAAMPTSVTITNNKIVKVSNVAPLYNKGFQVPTSASFTRMPVVLRAAGTTAATRPVNNKTYTMVPVQVSRTPNQTSLLKINQPNQTSLLKINQPNGSQNISTNQTKMVPVANTSDNPVTSKPASTVSKMQTDSTNSVKKIVRVNIAPTTTVQRVTTPAVLQTNVKVTQAELPVTTINIDTVGLQKITELIARKNPIPNYKPPPVPENLKSVIGPRQSYVCYECGDTYLLLDSLLHHRGRYSLKIVFKCDDCNVQKTFFNKCQFLGHLRGHLNIEKTQAVPIHIKSDSITISTLPVEYQKLMFNQKVVKKTSTIFKEIESTKRCRECGLVLSTEKLLEHYGKDKTDCDYRNACGQCHMRLPTTCALRAHRRFHRGQHPNICPECGTGEFFGPSDSDKEMWEMWDNYDFYCYHLRDECFHLSRAMSMVCPKCEHDCENIEVLKNHLMEKLEQYFKCQACPMAFKSQETFRKHYEGHKEKKEVVKGINFKIIYRCHICDSVMDDRGVLEIHTSHHTVDLKGKAVFKFKCLCCDEYFKSKDELSAHFSQQHSTMKGSRLCLCCQKRYATIHEVVEHHLTAHHINHFQTDLYKPCSACGLMIKASDLFKHSMVCMAAELNSFECDICYKKSTSRQGHTLHLKKHKQSGALVCTPCHKTDFKNMDELKEHEKNCVLSNPGQFITKVKKPSMPNVNFHTNVGVHPCTSENCGKSFVTLDELNQHRKNDHGLNLLFPCHLCGLTYENQTSLHKHIRVMHEAKRHVYPCWVCRSRKIKRVFSTKALLEKHVTTRHRIPKDQLDESQFVREYDDSDEKEFGGRNFQENLKRKVSTVEPDSPVKKLRVDGENMFNCAKCVYSSEDRTVFLDHILAHKTDKYVQCLECGLSFAVLPSLRKHLFMVHKIKDFDIYCRDTGIEQIKEEVLDDEDLVLTVQSDDSEQIQVDVDDADPLECRVCHKMFDSETNVRAHMRTHGMAFIRSKRKAAKLVPLSSTVVNGNESSDSSHSSVQS